MTEILDTLTEYITNKFLKSAKHPLRPDEALISSGLIDSFNLVDLAVFIEDTYGVRLDDTELNRDTFDTLGQLAAIIQARKYS